jgi:HAD superfamily hydrolase (TIGR01484 family)
MGSATHAPGAAAAGAPPSGPATGDPPVGPGSGGQNLLQDIRMLVTDVDGTLVGRKPEFELYRGFRVRIDELRMNHDTVWVICTGRGLRSFSRVFLPMRAFGVVPDYVITRHAYIFEKVAVGYRPHSVWNLRVLAVQWQNRWRVRRAIPHLHRIIRRRIPYVRIVYHSGDRICFRFDDTASADFAADILRSEARPYSYLRVFQHVREVDVRVVPFTKGLAVAELARHLRVTSPRILVIGDGHNDISMMEVNASCRTACPFNAAPEVVETVHKTHGHIAGKPHLAGVMEILDAYETGAVQSELPDGWKPPATTANPVRAPRRRHRRMDSVASVLILLAAIYTTLVVLATFGLLPGQFLLRPYQTLLALVERLLRAVLPGGPGVP